MHDYVVTVLHVHGVRVIGHALVGDVRLDRAQINEKIISYAGSTSWMLSSCLCLCELWQKMQIAE